MKLLDLGSVKLALSPIAPAADKRSAERLAAHKLLAQLLGLEQVEIGHNADGAPFIVGSTLKVSISHSRDIAAVAVAPDALGIDIEQARPEQLKRIAARVLSAEELIVYSDRLLQAWTLKEALYKASTNADADFRSDINLPLAEGQNKTTVAASNGATECFDILFSQEIEVDGLCAWLSVVCKS